MYAGAVRQTVTSAGLRPASDAALRTRLTAHRTTSLSATPSTKPSAFRPMRSRARGPIPAIQTGSRPYRTHGNCTLVPLKLVSRPSAKSWIASAASANDANEAGSWPITRNEESPRPMAQIVRLPNISLRVAKSEAVTDQSRVLGFVTMGPTVTLLVAARIWAYITNGSSHSTHES